MSHPFSAFRLVAALAVAATVSLAAACNSHPVEFTSSSAQIERLEEVPVESGGAVDILWVIDNSGSMCQEQKLLRDNFEKFISLISEGASDFHVAVTTTHFDRRNSPVQFEPVAEGGHLQSTPSPVPFPDESCQFASDQTGELKNASHSEGPDFQPIKNAVAQAVSCAQGDYSNLLDGPDGNFPSDERIVCALYGKNPPSDIYSGGDPCQAADATKHDGRIHKNDLFPCGSQHDPNPGAKCPKEKLDEVYRDIPKVLRAEDYSDGGGIDQEQLDRDFACMSFVGTRGNGIEQGLKALNRSIDPELTGGPVSDPQDEATPNHGFIRQNADFATIFVADENDCSYGDGWGDYVNKSETPNGVRDDCEGANCYFPTKNAEDQSPLQNVQPLIEKFKKRLAESKGVDVEAVEAAINGAEDSEFNITMASIDGGYKPFEGEVPSVCSESSTSYQPLSCSNAKGQIFTGDRYHDFIRQFDSRFPELGSGLGNRESETETQGLLCRGNFDSALEGIAERIETPGGSCVQNRVTACGDDGGCPDYQFGGGEGQCKCWGRTSGGTCESGDRFCDSAIQVRIRPDDTSNAAEKLKGLDTDFCIPDSIGTKNFPNSCVVKREFYSWQPCPGDPTGAIQLQWNPGRVPNPTRALQGFDLLIRYAQETGSGTASSGGDDAGTANTDSGS